MGGRGGTSNTMRSGGNPETPQRQTIAEINARAQEYYNLRRDQYNHVHDQGTMAQLETYREVEYLLSRSSEASSRGNTSYARRLETQAQGKYNSLPNYLRTVTWEELAP